jgi:quercetin dioxygenase-like cupin family protein
MPVVDYAAMPEIAMRAGITGKWIAGRDQGTTAVSVLSNTVEPRVSVPRHFHEHEEVVLVEEGQIWVEIDGARVAAEPGQAVIIPARAVHAWGTLSHARVLFIWPVLEPFAVGKSAYVEGAPPRVA